MKAIAKDPDVDTRRPVTIRPGDEINLSEYVGTAWRYRWLILAIVAVTALVTYLVNRQITPTYEVTVRMLATESQVMDDATRRALSVARFRELLESPSLIATVLQEFGLSAPPHRITPHGFLANNLSVREIPDTGILSASVRFTDPGKLVNIANKYAESAVNLASRLNTDETTYARDLLKKQADESRKQLTRAENELEAVSRQGADRAAAEGCRSDSRPPARCDVVAGGHRGRARPTSTGRDRAVQAGARSRRAALARHGPRCAERSRTVGNGAQPDA